MGDLTNKGGQKYPRISCGTGAVTSLGNVLIFLHVWLRAGTRNCYSYYRKYVKTSNLLNFRPNQMVGPIYVLNFLIGIYWWDVLFSTWLQANPMTPYGCIRYPFLSCHPVYMLFTQQHHFSRHFGLLVHSSAKKDRCWPPKIALELIFKKKF